MTGPRFATVTIAGERRYGLLTDNGLIDLQSRFGAAWPSLQAALAAGALPRLAEEAHRPADIALAALRFEPPVVAPGKILCVGVNYPDRNAEYRDGAEAPAHPSLFVRFPGSFTGHGESLIRPPESRQLDYEGEVAVIIGKAGRRIAERDAFGHIAGLTLCNEGTVRDWVRHGKFNVTQGKNFDRSGALGPWLVPFAAASQIEDIALTTRVNGEIRQQDRTSRMIFGVPALLRYISTFTTLLPGDIIVTGTPTGAGARFDPPRWLAPGDVVEIEAEGLGCLRNSVADENPDAQ